MKKRHRSRGLQPPAGAHDLHPVRKSHRGTLVRYVLLAGGCLAAAAVICLVIASRLPLPPLSDEASPAPDAQAAISAEPTITLAIEPAPVSAEQLRSELKDLGTALVEQFPRVPQALHVAAQLSADLQQTTDAIATWRRCIEIAPQQPGPYVGLATALMAVGKDDEAVGLLRQGLADGCSSPDMHRQLAAALTKLGNLDEAETTLQQGMRSFSPSPEDWRQLGQVQLELGKFEQAEASLRQALDQGLASDNVLFSLATACARQGKDEEAARFRDRFAKRREERSSTQVQFQDRYDDQLRRIAVVALANAGAVYAHNGQAAEAERLLLRSNALAPDSSAVCAEIASLMRKQGRMADALVAHRRLLALEPQVAEHYVNAASMAMLVGDTRLAESTLKELIGKRPGLAVGYSNLARVYLQTGEAKQARWFAEAALKQSAAAPDESLNTYVLLAAACQQEGDVQAARQALETARRLSPGDPRLSDANLPAPLRFSPATP